MAETLVRGIVRLFGRSTWTSSDGTIVVAPRNERLRRSDRRELKRLSAADY